MTAPVGEEIGRIGGVADDAVVGAAVAKAEHRVRIAHELRARILEPFARAVGGGEIEDLAAVALQKSSVSGFVSGAGAGSGLATMRPLFRG